MKTNPNDPIIPTQVQSDINYNAWETINGLTKREHMAIEFLKGILSAQIEMRATGRQPDKIEMENYCLEAIEWSDILISKLNS